jgi:hypothetical protein
MRFATVLCSEGVDPGKSVNDVSAKKDSARADYFPLALDRKRTVLVSAPLIVNTHRQFETAILRIREALASSSMVDDKDRFLCNMYYVLGWCVGDFGKGYGAEHRLSARIVLQLTKKHQENLALGEHVSQCIRTMGLWCRRYGDRPVSKSNPNGSFFWKSAFSPVIGWLHTAALGMAWEERTTSHSVKMDWMLLAPVKFRLWFLRGIADSDGNVNLRNKIIEITSSPNTYFFHRLFDSLGIKSTVRFSRGYGYVSVAALAAARVQIFSPDVLTYRRETLEKLVGARTFQGPWPEWLEDLVQVLIAKGLSAPEIRDVLLEEQNVYVKMQTIKRKVRKASMVKGR